MWTMLCTSKEKKMKLLLDYQRTRKFTLLIKRIPDNVKEISASIAFTQDDTLMKNCNNKKIHLDWWGLFNSDVSSKLEIVKDAIKSPYIKFFPFAKLFHLVSWIWSLYRIS